jgi:hypothetical protein
LCVPAGDLGAGGARGVREKEEEEEEGSALPSFPLPADFFHPAHVAPHGSPPPDADPSRIDPSRLASPASRVPSPCPGAGPRPAPRPQRLTCSSTPRSDEPKTAGWGRSPDLQTSKPPCSPPLPSGSKETLHQIFRDCCERVVQSFYRLGSLELCRLFVKCQMSKDKEKVIELSSLYSPPVTAVDFLPSGIVSVIHSSRWCRH